MRKLGIGEYSRKARGMTITMPKDGYPRGFVRVSGADEGRTHNLLDATEALSQLSYRPQFAGIVSPEGDVVFLTTGGMNWQGGGILKPPASASIGHG